MSANLEETWGRLGEFVAQVMKAKNVPGIAVGVLYQGETRAAGFGVTSVDHPLPVTPETLFQIGSITKTFTGAAIMRLVEMGKLELEATVRTYAPDFKAADETAAAQVTIRHLLTHMAGWDGDLFDDTGAGDDALSRYVAGMAELEQLAPLGAVWSYNNAGFSLAGYIIERVAGKSYQTAMKELVFEPLGLQHCYFDPGEVMTHRFVVGHHGGDNGPQIARPWPLPRSGGIICHAPDLLRYARFHLGDGGAEDGSRLLKPESVAQMQAPQVTVWGDEAWGLTWAVNKVEGVSQISHGGGTMGQISLLALLPERQFAIAILTNADRGGEATHEISRWALKEYLGLGDPDPKPLESSTIELAPYVGRYSRPFAEVELGLLGGKLVGQITYKGSFPTKDTPPPPSPPPMSITRCEPDRLLVLDGPFKNMRADVIRRPDGSIGWLRAGGRIHARQG